MQALGTIADARKKVLADAKTLVERVKELCDCDVTTVDQAVGLLQKLRQEAAEDLNQIQHENMILSAVEWLVDSKRCAPGTVWQWNPRQTGSGDEPDLRGFSTTGVITSAEATTSLIPQGTIQERMAETLQKLARMPGTLFYFVKTEPMAKRARTKIKKAGYLIEVVLLSS